MERSNEKNEGVRDMQILLGLRREELLRKGKDELIDFTLLLGRVLLRHIDETYGPREAAEMFNRKKTWIYDAMHRPRTQLQRDIAKVAGREDGGLLFRLSDLIQIRDGIFESSEAIGCPS